MARKLRLQYPGAIYHVLSREDRRESIVKDDRDRSRFVETLAEACGKTDWQVQAYCLMPNHFHLVVTIRSRHRLVLELLSAVGNRILGMCQRAQFTGRP